MIIYREFECRGQKYKVKIRPASIEDKDGKERYYYPSKREELVEDALRKFVAEGQGVFLDDAAGVTLKLWAYRRARVGKEPVKNLALSFASTHSSPRASKVEFSGK